MFRPFFNNIQGYQEKVFALSPINMSWGVGNISADPLFRDPANGDYSLQEESPCIDAGHYESAPDPDGTRSDLGAIPFDQGNGGQRVEIYPGQHNTIQDCIDAAHPGDIVLVLPGVYDGFIDFSGKAITVASRSLSTEIASYADSTIIDAGGQGSVVMFASGEDERSILDGFTLRNGIGTWYEGQNYFGNLGGGIFCLGSSPVIRNSLVTGNDVGNRGNRPHGGGVFCGEGSEPLLQNLRITNNRAMYGGGMAFRGESHVTMENVTISSNRATAGDDSWGGGIWCFENSSFVMEGGKISDNYAAGGGAISMTVNEGSSILRKVAIVNNEGYFGSAFYGNAFPMVFDQVTFSRNEHWQVGASVFDFRGHRASLVMKNSILSNNQARLFFFRGQEDTLSFHYCVIEGGEDSIRANQNVVLDYDNSNFDADPQFTDPDAGDYSLAENSPCIDAGDPDSNSDPDGTRADVGAFYFHQLIERDPMILTVPGDFPTIQAAIDASQFQDTIQVDPGHYTENINFNGKLITVASRFLTSRDPEYIQRTIIDGGGIAETVRFGRGETGDSRLIGFTITGGNGREGGGVFCLRASPEISYCVIAGNNAQDGGGIYLYGSGPQINNLTITGNASESGASGIHMRNGAYPTITNTIIYGNGAHSLVVSADRDPCTILISYSDIEGGQNAFEMNNNGNLRWDITDFAADPRFVDAQEGDYRLSENSPCIDAGDPEGIYDLDGSPADIGALGFFHAPQVEEFAIPLHRGWGLIGSPVIVPDPSMETIWRQQVGAEDLTIVKDMDGRFFAPPNNFNNIPGWVSWQGYAVKLVNDGSLAVQGQTIEPDAPIPLRRGWSIISYQPTDPVRIEDAFASVEDDILLVKDERGRFYTPRFGFQPMITMTRGKGYKVLTRRAIDLVWGGGRIAAIPPKAEEEEPFPSNRRFQPTVTDRNMSVLLNVKYTGSPHSFAGREVVGSPVVGSPHSFAGWEIELAAFTSKGLVVGYALASVSGDSALIGLSIWGDDPTTAAVEGCVEGESLLIRGWQDGAEFEATVKWVEGESEYATDGFAYGELMLDGSLPVSFALEKPYPNPFNSTVVIVYALPMASDVDFVVTDITGREMFRSSEEMVAAGRHRLSWSGESLSTGLYIITMHAGQFKQSEKLVLVK